MRTARAARAAFSEWRVAPLPYAKQMEHRCLRSMARHARVEGQVQVQVQVQAQVQVQVQVQVQLQVQVQVQMQVQVQVHGHAPVV